MVEPILCGLDQRLAQLQRGIDLQSGVDLTVRRLRRQALPQYQKPHPITRSILFDHRLGDLTRAAQPFVDCLGLVTPLAHRDILRNMEINMHQQQACLPPQGDS